MKIDESQLANWYDNQIRVGLDSHPVIKPKDHTMGRSLLRYIKKAIPFEILDKIIVNEDIIEIHGIFDGHMEIVKQKQGWNNVEYVWGIQKPERIFKSQYPRLYLVRKGSQQFFILTVFPGKDYVDHNAALIRNYIERKKLDCQIRF